MLKLRSDEFQTASKAPELELGDSRQKQRRWSFLKSPQPQLEVGKVWKERKCPREILTPRSRFRRAFLVFVRINRCESERQPCQLLKRRSPKNVKLNRSGERELKTRKTQACERKRESS